MRIERIHVDAFGPLEGFDTGGQALGDLVVVLGPNEAGKSTLFSFLTTALYGFHPASRENNPQVPWGADEAAGRIDVTIGDGVCAQVERRLRASPSGRLTESGVTRELRNHPVPWAEHVPRTVFRQVFAVTLADLAGLDPDTWGRIQERLVGSMGSSDLGSARSVADALEREASELWRPNRRGNQRIRVLQAEVRTLRSRRAGALTRDREIRALVEERDNVQVRLREVRAERQQHRVAVERVQSLLPVRRQLARIDTLRQQGGPPEELEGLPSDPSVMLGDLDAQRRRLSDRLSSLHDELRDPEAAIAEFDQAVRGLLARGDEVARFLALAAEVAPDRRRARELTVELGDVGLELTTAGEHLLDGGWNASHADAIGSFSVELLEDRIRRARTLEAAPSATAHAEDGHAGPLDRDRHRNWLLGVSAAGLLAGVALLAWGMLGGPTAALAAGATAVAAGAIGALLAGPWPSEQRVRVDDSREIADADARRASGELTHMLSGLPVRAEYLDPPGDPLSSGLARLRDLVLAERALRRAFLAAEERVASADGAAERIAATLGRNGAPTAEGLAPILDRELRAAERVSDAAQSAERDCRRLRLETDTCGRELEAVTGRITTLEAALVAIGPGDAASGAETAGNRLEAHRRADQLADELERSHPDLAELTAQIEAIERTGHVWSVDDVDLARRRTHIEELDAQVERLIADAEALQRNAEHLRDMETVDGVDSEIASLQETEARLMRERDRKWVLAQLVREADRRFREEHQPDLVRRASEHLEHLTGGRYDRLLIDETRVDGLFQIMGPSLPAPVPLGPPVSTGTLEQAYLSLRLAIVDHLDEGRESLPLFIDEALVNWDRERRDRGLDVLADLSASRQIFVFTCHPDIASRLESRGGRLITLERRP